jgi:mono/diheme cytochrome c family protein
MKRHLKILLVLSGLIILSPQMSSSASIDNRGDMTRIDQIGHSAITDGRRLLGELNCTSCHQDDIRLHKSLSIKQAPHLTGVGNRLESIWMFNYLMDPQFAQPGTTMPDVLHGLPMEKKVIVVDEIVSYLESLQSPEQLRTGSGVARGKQLYNNIGCVSCHGTPKSQQLPSYKKFNLQHLEEKYQHASSLATFLVNPHQLRPSGRMPGMHLTFDEAHAVARYLGVNAIKRNADRSGALIAGLKYERFNNLANDVSLVNLERSAPNHRWVTNGFSYPPFGHLLKPQWILQSGYLEIKKDGNKTFILKGNTSGSLWIGDFKICELKSNGAIKAHTEGELFLRKGMHAIRVMQLSDHVNKTVQLLWKDNRRAYALIPQHLLRYRHDGQLLYQNIDDSNNNVLDFSSKITAGKRHFNNFGCANCHQTTQIPSMNSANEYTFSALPLSLLSGDRLSGCLSNDDAPVTINNQIVRYALTDDDRFRIATVLNEQEKILQSKQIGQVHDIVKTMNCTSCHDETSLLETMPVQLQLSWLKHAIETPESPENRLAKRMPQYGVDNVSGLADAMKGAVHTVSEWIWPVVVDSENALNPMVATGASCVSCHTSDAMISDMGDWSKRFERGWFAQYLQITSTSGGSSHHTLKANIAQQTQAIWSYADGLNHKNQGQFVVLANHNDLDENFDLTKTSLLFYNVQGVPYWAIPLAGPATNTGLEILNVKRQSYVWDYFAKNKNGEQIVEQQTELEPFYTGINLYEKRKLRIKDRLSIGDLLKSCFDESTLRKSNISDLLDKLSGKKSLNNSRSGGNNVRIRVKLKTNKANIKISYRF